MCIVPFRLRPRDLPWKLQSRLALIQPPLTPLILALPCVNAKELGKPALPMSRRGLNACISHCSFGWPVRACARDRCLVPARSVISFTSGSCAVTPPVLPVRRCLSLWLRGGSSRARSRKPNCFFNLVIKKEDDEDERRHQLHNETTNGHSELPASRVLSRICLSARWSP
ncbi:hypothetical protein NDU88_000020 [Pleurodeles waltl]|uniref:Uncharacterized protein n=1 Tax=Pleurodeles waltl TaxID=8319 RepID=A0AAV7KUH1_PLEWA|nr:hypothetical protein NDU88_000020 [Pleurodeles waltl]